MQNRADVLAAKAKELMYGMKTRTGRYPDVADFKAAFEPLLADSSPATEPAQQCPRCAANEVCITHAHTPNTPAPEARPSADLLNLFHELWGMWHDNVPYCREVKDKWGTLQRLIRGAASPSSPSPTDSDISICPRCMGCGVYNFGWCSLCDGTGRLGPDGTAFVPVSPTPQEKHASSPTCEHGKFMFEPCEPCKRPGLEIDGDALVAERSSPSPEPPIAQNWRTPIARELGYLLQLHIEDTGQFPDTRTFEDMCFAAKDQAAIPSGGTPAPSEKEKS